MGDMDYKAVKANLCDEYVYYFESGDHIMVYMPQLTKLPHTLQFIKLHTLNTLHCMSVKFNSSQKTKIKDYEILYFI